MAGQSRAPDGALSFDSATMIGRALKVAGLSQGELAERAHIHPGELSKMLNRKRPAGVSHLKNVARVLGVRPGELLDAGSPNPEIRRRDQIDAWLETEGFRFVETIRNQVRHVLNAELAAQAAKIATEIEASEQPARKEQPN